MAEASKVDIKSKPTTAEAPKPAESALTLENAPKPTAAPVVEAPAAAAAPAVEAPKFLISDEDVAAVAQEVESKGSLSDATLKAWEQKGIPSHLLVRFVQGADAIKAVTEQAVYKEVGGKETYDAMRSWAGVNLPAAEKDAFDKVAKTGDQSALLAAVKGLHAKFVEANGAPPAHLNGGRRGTAGPEPYQSVQEAVRDMQNPLYHRDPAFRKQVESRMAASPNI